MASSEAATGSTGPTARKAIKMVDREKVGRGQRQSTPEMLPSTNPITPIGGGSDYSFVLPTLMELQREVGKLSQAILTISEHQKAQTTKLEEIGRDMHTGKILMRIISIAAIGLGGLLGWILARAWDVILKTYIPGH